MEFRLKIILIIVMLLLLLYIIKSIKSSKISTKNALIWVVADVIVIFCIILIDPLFSLANFIGVETVANMMFFLGIIFLLILCFNQSTELSILNKKVVTLTQELGILKKKKEEEEKNVKKIDKKKIFKYFFSSGSSFVIDILLFTLFNYVLKNILIATIIARIMSSLYNYLVNSRLVFKSYTKTSIIKYYCLVIIQMFVSAFLVSTFSNLLVNLNDTIIKFFVDVFIFVVNYFIQKEVVFK